MLTAFYDVGISLFLNNWPILGIRLRLLWPGDFNANNEVDSQLHPASQYWVSFSGTDRLEFVENTPGPVDSLADFVLPWV